MKKSLLSAAILTALASSSPLLQAETITIQSGSIDPVTASRTDKVYQGTGSETITVPFPKNYANALVQVNAGGTLAFNNLENFAISDSAPADRPNFWSSAVFIRPDGDSSSLSFNQVKNFSIGTADQSADYFWSVYMTRGQATFDGGNEGAKEGVFSIHNNGYTVLDKNGQSQGTAGYGIYSTVQKWPSPDPEQWGASVVVRNYDTVLIDTYSVGVASSLVSDGNGNGSDVTIDAGTAAISSSHAQAVAAYDMGHKGNVNVTIRTRQDLTLHSDAAQAVLVHKNAEGTGTLDITSTNGTITATTDSKTASAVAVGGDNGANAKLSVTGDDIVIGSQADTAVSIGKDATLSLQGITKGKTVIDGSVAGDGGNLEVSKQTIDVERGTFHVGTVTADNDGNSSLIFHTTEQNGVAADQVNGKLNLIAGGNVTEQYGSADRALQEIRSNIVGGNAKEQLADNVIGSEASDMTGAWTVDKNGNISYVNGEAQSDTLVAVRHMNAATLTNWRYEVNHLSDRLGDVRANRTAIGSWARIYGADNKVGDTLRTRIKSNSVQAGTDFSVSDNWIVGAAFSYTNSDASFANGSGSSDTYTLALYGTGYFPCGAYVDVIGRLGRIATDIDVTTQTLFSGSYDNTAFGLSAEIGYQWNINPTFFVTPQAELSYGYVKGDDYSAANGITISQDNFQTLVGRLGAQAGAHFAEGKGQIYLSASVNHDFQGDTEATASKAGAASQTLKEDLGATWFSYGVGFQYATDNRFQIYGSVAKANGNDYQDDYRYSLGVRYNW